MLEHAFFPEADTGFRQSQASLIWRELEEEEEGLAGGLNGLLQSALRRTPMARNTHEEDEDRNESVQRHLRRRSVDHPDDDCGRYFALATMAAVFALIINLVYSLFYKLDLSGG